MKFKVGQVWRDGSGDLHTIKDVFHDTAALYPVVAEANNGGGIRSYTQTGRYIGEDNPCGLDLDELVLDVDETEQAEQEQRDEIVRAQAEASGNMLDEYGDRALFDALIVQSVVTGMIERQSVEKVLAGIRMIIEARRSL